ncbi:hypothetical protein NKG94_04165 [Micromonospora sp. M12]
MTLLAVLQRRAGRPERRMPRITVIAAILVLLVGLACVVAPGQLAPHPPDAVAPEVALLPPGLGHPFGTDELGRDLLSRVIHGSRLSLLVGIAATILALLAGAALGLVAGLFGGFIDTVLMRVVDVMLSFPRCCWPSARSRCSAAPRPGSRSRSASPTSPRSPVSSG